MNTKDEILVCCDACGSRDLVPRVYNDPICAVRLHTYHCMDCDIEKNVMINSNTEDKRGDYYVDRDGDVIWRYKV